jgi:hypothetical protein
LINQHLAENNRNLVEYGIFYNNNDLKFEEDNNTAMDNLIEKCGNLKRIYLLNKTNIYGNLLKEKILNIEFNKNNFKITFCYGLDEVIHENLKSYKVDGVQIPGIVPPKHDFHSKFFNFI